MDEPLRVGVLALQGAFHEHITMLNTLPNVEAFAVRTPSELARAQAVVLPGGESTAMGLVAQRNGLLEPLQKLTQARHVPIFATCAGLIMLADKAVHEKEGGQPLLGGLSVLVDRNHFGKQAQSFETDLAIHVPGSSQSTCKALFIRAPAILEIHSDDVNVLARVPKDVSPRPGKEDQDVIVAVQQGPFLATAFHPELTDDVVWHRFFVEEARKFIKSLEN